MPTQAEWERRLAATYPTFEPAAPDEPVDPDALEMAEELHARVEDQVHAFETQLHRPLQPHERDEIAAAVTTEFVQAQDHAARVIGRFEDDLSQQLPLLERDLGRRLLTDEVEGIRAQAWHALNARGETLDAEQAWSDHWRHHNTATGAEPPDMNKRHDTDKYMADRAREQLRSARAAEQALEDTTEPAAKTEWAEGSGANAAAENARRMTARAYELSGRDLPRDLRQYATQTPAQDEGDHHLEAA